MGEGNRTNAAAAGWVEELPVGMLPPERGGGGLVGPLADGTWLVARPVSVGSPGQADVVVAHLRRLGGLSEPALVPLRGAVHDRSTVWALSERDDGKSLAELLVAAPLSPLHATAIGIEVLGGLVALRRAGLGHGSLHADGVRVGRDGRVRLGDYALRPRWREGADRPLWPDPRGDLVAAGALLCAALGISPSPPPGELSEPERVAPGLAAAARAMARGSQGRNANAALAAVRAAAGRLAAPELMRRARRELAALAGGDPAAGREPDPAVVEPPPVPPAPPAPLRPEPAPVGAPEPIPARRDSGRRPLRWVAAALVAALAVGGLAYGAAHRTRLEGGPLSAAARQAPGPAPSASPAAAGRPDRVQAPQPSAEEPRPAEPPEAAGVAGPPTATDAVATFYQLIGEHRFDGAVQLWSDRMRASYPPAENIDQRFTDTSALRLLRNDLSSSGDGRAVVTIDLVEVRAGRTYHWVGAWYLVRGSTGWLLDQPALRAA